MNLKALTVLAVVAVIIGIAAIGFGLYKHNHPDGLTKAAGKQASWNIESVTPNWFPKSLTKDFEFVSSKK